MELDGHGLPLDMANADLEKMPLRRQLEKCWRKHWDKQASRPILLPHIRVVVPHLGGPVSHPDPKAPCLKGSAG